MKKNLRYALIIGVILIILSIGIILFYPKPIILENKPFDTFICTTNPFTYVGIGSYPCTNSETYLFKQLVKWKGYKGCNESTKGYEEGYITNLISCNYVTLN